MNGLSSTGLRAQRKHCCHSKLKRTNEELGQHGMTGERTGDDGKMWKAGFPPSTADLLHDHAEELLAIEKCLIGFGEMIACYIEAEVAPNDPAAFAADQTTRLYAAGIRTIADKLRRLSAAMKEGIPATTG